MSSSPQFVFPPDYFDYNFSISAATIPVPTPHPLRILQTQPSPPPTISVPTEAAAGPSRASKRRAILEEERPKKRARTTRGKENTRPKAVSKARATERPETSTPATSSDRFFCDVCRRDVKGDSRTIRRHRLTVKHRRNVERAGGSAAAEPVECPHCHTIVSMCGRRDVLARHINECCPAKTGPLTAVDEPELDLLASWEDPMLDLSWCDAGIVPPAPMNEFGAGSMLRLPQSFL